MLDPVFARGRRWESLQALPRSRRPKLGQHFLSDARIRERLVGSIPLSASDLVVEIGPGKGAMTGLLAAGARRVVAVELDAALSERLEQHFHGDSRVEVVRGDILTTDLGEVCRRRQVENCYVFGNLPYYITSPILHHLFRHRRSIRGMALLVQREVAERITAAPGSRAYGYLSVLAQLYSRPRIVFFVPPGAFSPPPKVQSALVQFEMTEYPSAPGLEAVDAEELLEFAKVCFAQKRKSVLNNLSKTFGRTPVEHALAGLGLARSVRAEQLSLNQLARLYTRLGEPSGQVLSPGS
ncbi:MAG TPA: 16S rRNA (adenine(1518)-N(6)/adenine(1519)-N(6))-dimethyltransferase RsmA [Terriglobia bacterium]|nr:16S rRNA (adenine(1518)-N(6)/adenine(1519)-N(6))-dimethyltransferase RsmA [Terriglobia bacterium]